ncbi:MAG: lipopolysaccharide biosynthesis protein [Vulcanimicrobiaceae bacterium]
MQVFKQWPIYFIGRILPAAIGFAGLALYTRLLDPGSFGIYALLLSTAYLIGTVGYAWIRVSVLRMVASLEGEDEPAYLATVAGCFALTSLVIFAAVVVILRLYQPSLPLALDALAGGCALASGWFELNVTMLQARVNVVGYGLLQFARALGTIVCSLLFIHAGLKAAGLLGGFALGNATALAALREWRPTLRGRFDMEIFARIVRFGWPSSASSLSYAADTFQRYLLDLEWGASAVGIFSAATNLAQQSIGVFVGTAALAGQPLAFRIRDRGTKEELSAQLRHNAALVFGVALPAAAGLAVLAPSVSHLYLGYRFRLDAPLLIAIATSTALFTGIRGNYFEQAFEIAMNTRPVAITTGIRSFLTCALSIPLITRFGAVGAAAAVAGSEALGLAIAIVWARRVVHTPIPVMAWLKTTVATAVMVAAILLVPDRLHVAGVIEAFVAGVLAFGIASALLNLSRVRRLSSRFALRVQKAWR